ncbi:MAG: hypothetical protein PGN11_13575 [Quadrisphaera sp.]
MTTLHARTRGPVHVVGTGLLGTSAALALRARGVETTLADPSPTAAALARDLGAGRLRQDDDAPPALVVVASPPDVTAPRWWPSSWRAGRTPWSPTWPASSSRCCTSCAGCSPPASTAWTGPRGSGR